MTELHQLATRIKLKYDTYANWTSRNPVLLEGEVAIATIPTGATTSPTMANLPNIVIKVGGYKLLEDGTYSTELAHYNELRFVSALAADVYDWAKADTKPTYTASEINADGSLTKFVNNIIGNTEAIQDTDTQYTIQVVEGKAYTFNLMKKNKGEADDKYALVTTIDLSEVDSRLDKVEELLGGTGAKSVADQISDAVAGLYMETPVESAEGSGVILASLKQENGVVEATTRNIVEADLPALSIAKTTGLQDALDSKQKKLTFTEDYVEDTSIIPTTDYVNDVAASAINISNGDAAVEGEFVTAAIQTNGEVKVERRALKSSDFADDVVPFAAVAELEESLAKKQDNLAFMTAASDTNPVATKTEIDSINTTIEGMDMAKVTATTGKIINSIVEEDGTVTADLRDLVAADIPVIAQSQVDGLTDALTDLTNNKQDNLAWAGTAVHVYDKDNNKVVTEEYLNDAIAGLNGAMHFIGAIATVEEVEAGVTFEQALANANITNLAGGDVVLYGYDEYVYDAQNAKWVPLGNESIYYTDAEAAEAHEAFQKEIDALKSNKQDSLTFKGTYSAENPVMTQSAVAAAITTSLELNSSTSAGDGEFIGTVVQENGAVTATVKKLASSDFADDLVPMSAVNGLEEEFEKKQDVVPFNSTPSESNKVATMTEVNAVSTTVSGLNMAEVTSAAGSGVVIASIKQDAGLVAVETRKLEAADMPEGIDQAKIAGLADALAAKQNQLAFMTEPSDTNKVATAADLTAVQNAASAALANLDYTDDSATEGQFVTKVTQNDGQIAVTRSAIDAKYLTQTTGDYLVLDCGSATVNI